MKKIVLSIAGVMAAAAFAPEASAVPAFARQTGMACNACHQQHFPVLNGFGQAFKAAGYTMMGAQDKVEGEHLSIPSHLNAGLLFKARYQDTNGSDAAGVVSGTTTNGGQWQIPDEFALFFGGRIAENIGFMMENAVAGNGAGGIIAGFKMPFIFDMGGAKLGVTPFTTDNLGVAYGYEKASNGMTRGIRWAEHANDISAQQYVGIGRGGNTGLALSAENDMGYINFTRFTPNFTASGATGVQLRSNWLRIAATPTVGDWNMHIGAGFASGTNYGAPAALATMVDTKATVLDFQGQGVVGGKDLSVYVSYARAPYVAPVAGGTTGNLYHGMSGTAQSAGAGAAACALRAPANCTATSAFTIGADYSVIPHVLHIGANYLRGKNGDTSGLDGENSLTLTAVYDLAQNVALHVNYSQRSGSAFNDTGVAATSGANSVTGTTFAAVPNFGKTLTTFMLEAAW